MTPPTVVREQQTASDIVAVLQVTTTPQMTEELAPQPATQTGKQAQQADLIQKQREQSDCFL